MINLDDCIFCKIVSGKIPAHKIYENEKILAFLDIGPLSEGHSLVIPKKHSQKLTEVEDNTLSEIVKCAKNIAKALNCENYNILQNNGKLANQAVGHVHFHIIPKTKDEGLDINWKPKEDTKELKELSETLKGRINHLYQ